MNLSHRILRADIILTFKILNNLVYIEKSSVFITHYTSNHGSLIKIRKENVLVKQHQLFLQYNDYCLDSITRTLVSDTFLSIIVKHIDTINIKTNCYAQPIRFKWALQLVKSRNTYVIFLKLIFENIINIKFEIT